MDFLDFVITIDQSLGIGVPEADCAQFATLDSGVGDRRGRFGRA